MMEKKALTALPHKKLTLTPIGTSKPQILLECPKEYVRDEFKLSKPELHFGETHGMEEQNLEEGPEEDPNEDYEPGGWFYHDEAEHSAAVEEEKKYAILHVEDAVDICEGNEEENAAVEEKKKYPNLHARDSCDVVKEDMNYFGVGDETGIKEEDDNTADVKQEEMVDKNCEHRFVVSEERHKIKNQKSEAFIRGLERNAKVCNSVEGDVCSSLPAEESGDVVNEDFEYLTDGTVSDQEDNADHVGDEEDEMVNTHNEDYHVSLKDRNKIFIGGLDNSGTEDHIKKVFGGVGKITNIKLMTNTINKKGFAILSFATSLQAKRAITKIRNPMLNGKKLSVSPYISRDTLFLGNICKLWTKLILEERLRRFGVDKYENLRLVEDPVNAGNNRGFAFINFSSYSDTMNAYKRLQMRDVVLGVNRSAKVAFASHMFETGDRRRVTRVFLDGLPSSWDEDRVKLYLKKFGKIEKIMLANNIPSARRNDFGLVTFDNPTAAVACVEAINNFDLGERFIKVRAKLSDPCWRHVHRGNYPLSRKPDFESITVGSKMNHKRERKPYMELHGSGGHNRSKGYRGELSVMPRSDKALSHPKNCPKSYHHTRNGLALRGRPAQKNDYVVKKYYHRSGHSLGESGKDPIDSYRTASQEKPTYAYVDEACVQRIGWPTSSHHEEHADDDYYDSFPMLKRYSELDDIPSSARVPPKRGRLDYESSALVSNHGHAYNNRDERSFPRYVSNYPRYVSNSSRSYHPSRRTLEYFCSRQETGNSRDPLGNHVDYGEMYSQSYDEEDMYTSEYCFSDHQDTGYNERGSVDYVEMYEPNYSHTGHNERGSVDYGETYEPNYSHTGHNERGFVDYVETYEPNYSHVHTSPVGSRALVNSGPRQSARSAYRREYDVFP